MNTKSLYLSSTSLLPEGEIDRPVVFLVEPYLTESVKLRLQNIGYEVIPKIWNNESHLNKAHDYLEKAYLSFKDKIGSVLNQLHQTNYPASFWEIPLASWLVHYLHALFDRYCRLKMAIELYGKENVTLLVCQYDIKLPMCYVDFAEGTSVTEKSVSAFYGLVAKEMNIPVLEFSSTEGIWENASTQAKRIISFSNSFYLKVLDRSKDKLSRLICSKFVREKVTLMVPYRFNFRERLVFSRKLDASFFPRNNEIRTILQEVDRTKLLSIAAKDPFEKLAIDLLPKFMPRYLLEEFESYEQQAKKWDCFKIYFSASGWRSNILFCYAASLGRLRGAKIVGCQHGGGYGQFERSHPEFIERRLNNFYITWGWKDSHYSGAQLLPLPQPELSLYADTHKTKIETVLWVGTAMTKQLVRFRRKMPDKLFGYLSCKKDFISHLNRDIRKLLIYRPHCKDYGWSSDEKKIFQKYPEVRIEHTGGLPELLQKVKLFICDHQSTSFMEALVTNTPTVLFWDTALRDERKTAIAAFDLLREAGILFHDPIKAAEQVNAIWDDVQGWWLHPDRQIARLKFMDTFCHADVNWQEKWIEAFRKIIES